MDIEEIFDGLSRDQDAESLCWQSLEIQNEKKEQCTFSLFNMIQKGDTQGVIDLYSKFPYFKNKIVSLSQWTPAQYAARYGNLELLKYFVLEGFQLETKAAPQGIIMCACYSNNFQILSYLIQDLKISPNPASGESPLRYCLKTELMRQANLLIGAGAYYYISNKICQGVTKVDQKFENAARQKVPQEVVFQESDQKESAKDKIRKAKVWNLLAIKEASQQSEFSYLKDLTKSQLKTIIQYMVPLQ